MPVPIIGQLSIYILPSSINVNSISITVDGSSDTFNSSISGEYLLLETYNNYDWNNTHTVSVSCDGYSTTSGTTNSNGKVYITLQQVIFVSKLSNGTTTYTIKDAEARASISSLATVATTGSYSDLSNKPTIPTVNNATLTIKRNNTSVGTFTANAGTDTAIDITVPTKVSDLTNDSGFISGITSTMVTNALGYTPYDSANPSGYQANVIETVKVNGTALTPSSKAVNVTVPTNVTDLADHANYVLSSSLSTVATTGSYSDLSNKPTIPTVNNATLTIQKNGTPVNTFTANASSDVTANITVPTKISDLTNDSNFADKDLSNLSTTGKNIANWSSNVTNCITEIPQDIKLELNNGTLTLKAGSKVYVPNGSGVFDELTLTADKTATQTANDTRMYFYNGSYIEKFSVSQCYSGSTAPGGQTYMFWYDTTNNVVKMTTNGGSTWTSGWSLPFCIATASSGALTSIDQVFNGLGYIGSTVFALPGVKAALPNGRNSDGTLKNTILTNPGVNIRTVSSGTNTFPIAITSTGSISAGTNYVYNEKENRLESGGTIYLNRAVIGQVSFVPAFVSGKITSLEIKTAFHAVDYSDWNEHRVVAFQAPTSANGYRWYRKYADGWVEQGCCLEQDVGPNGNAFALSIPMANSYYSATITPVNASGDGIGMSIVSRTTTDITFKNKNYGSSKTYPAIWQVSGMAA